jgi:hypothetical protein
VSRRRLGSPVTSTDHTRYVKERGIPDEVRIGEWGDATIPGDFYHFTRKIHLASELSRSSSSTHSRTYGRRNATHTLRRRWQRSRKADTPS